MNRIIKLSLLIVAASGLAALAAEAGMAGADAGKPVTYSLQGKYYETCACMVSCPCPSNATLPTGGEHCDAISLFHVDKGMVNQTKIDGINFAIVLRSPKGAKVLDSFEKGEMDLFTLYFDDKANDAQKQALGMVMPALFGTKEIKGSKPPQWAPMSLTVDGDTAKFNIDGGKKLAFEIQNIKLPGKTKEGAPMKPGSDRIELTNTAPFPWVGHITQGIGSKFHYDDLGSKWDYEGRNAFFGTFDAKGTYKPEAATSASKT